jgi:invasion protein IalB
MRPRAVACLLILGLMLVVGPGSFAQESGNQLTSNSWTSRCVSETRGGPASCSIDRRLVVQQTGQPFLTMAVQVAAEPRNAMLSIQTPLGLHLPSGVRLQIDAGEVLPVTLRACDANGCYADMPMDDALLKALKGGQSLRVTLETMAREIVNVDVPLAGFTRAYGGIE